MHQFCFIIYTQTEKYFYKMCTNQIDAKYYRLIRGIVSTVYGCHIAKHRLHTNGWGIRKEKWGVQQEMSSLLMDLYPIENLLFSLVCGVHRGNYL